MAVSVSANLVSRAISRVVTARLASMSAILLTGRNVLGTYFSTIAKAWCPFSTSVASDVLRALSASPSAITGNMAANSGYASLKSFSEAMPARASLGSVPGGLPTSISSANFSAAAQSDPTCVA